ncbi:unnamed protein product [Victoria cruziana]
MTRALPTWTSNRATIAAYRKLRYHHNINRKLQPARKLKPVMEGKPFWWSFQHYFRVWVIFVESHSLIFRPCIFELIHIRLPRRDQAGFSATVCLAYALFGRRLVTKCLKGVLLPLHVATE